MPSVVQQQAYPEEQRRHLPNGAGLGPYRIVNLIASGGMGDVYRAHDERLGRDVALKVLPAVITGDRERIDRFAQEAKSASALNHPHIVAIYEIGQARASYVSKDRRREELHYIAMELVEGETLREFLAGHPSMPRRLEILAQTADGLAKAHAAGIVHRDLKPDNIMISAEGYAKVVDFGLAKLVEPPSGWNPLGADSPTMRAITRQGELIGTAGYMSPEQIAGKPIDQRSDIFSFGCIVYEAVTGQKPFEGESFVDTLHQVLHGEPRPLEHADERVQHEMQRLIGKCLVKDRENRYQSLRDVALDLRALAREIDSARVIPLPRSASVGWLIAAMAICVGAAIVMIWRSRTPAAPPGTSHAAMRITTSGNVGHLAVSPDGRFVAYTTSDEKGQAVRLQQIATGSSVVIVPPVADTHFVGITFSPDSNYVLPTSYENSIYGNLTQVPLLGGPATALVHDADTEAAVSPDGTRVALVRQILQKGESDIVVTARDGSHERILTTLPLSEKTTSPAWSPDGKRIAVTHGRSIFTIDAATGAKASVPLAEWHGTFDGATWSARGDALIVSAVDERSGGHKQLMRVELPSGSIAPITDDDNDYAEPRATGSALTAIRMKRQATLWSVTPGAPAEELTKSVGSTDGLDGVAWTRDHRIVYTSSAAGTVDLWIANADGSSARQLTNDEGAESHPVVTADGATIVYSSPSRGQSTIWRMSLDGSQRRPIVTAPLIYDFAVTPDAKNVVYAAGSTLQRVPLDGGAPVTIARMGVWAMSLQVTPDGQAVIFSALEDIAPKLFRVPIGGGPVTKLLADRASDGAISPDGKLLACTFGLAEPCASLAILPATGGAARILPLNGCLYRWSPDGKSIVFVKDEGKKENLYLLPLDGKEAKPITSFTDGSIANFAWAPDGSRIVLTHYQQTRDVVMMSAR
ncbi:MAG TPA: protein kinase [Thermoanaerobaculia bacterium]|nr:protein kinase [Thermoanaerobaculia bacterium]